MDVVYYKDGKWFILDYKTNADGSNLDAEYKEQLDAYVAAFCELTGENATALIYHIDV
jgi:ATP-dependent exoDNAse (exonuclease V) beta subunit